MPTTGRRRLPILFAAGIAVGIAMLFVGAMWTTFVTPSRVWSQEQAEEFESANAALHAVREKFGAAVDSEAAQSEVAAAQDRFSRINSQLESAQYARDNWGTWIAAGGFVLIVVCGFGLMSGQQASSES